MYFPDPLCSLFGTTNDYDDLQTISQIMVENATGQTWPANSQYTNKFRVNSARQELELVNTSTAIAYIDIYEYVCKKTIQQADINNTLVTPLNWATGTAIINVTGGAAPRIWKDQSLGADPFDFTEVVNHIKILKKSKVQLGAGESNVYTMVLKKKFVFDGNDLSQYPANTRVGEPGKTRGYLIVVSGAASAASDAVPITLAVQTMNEYVCTPIAGIIKAQTAQYLP